ncbi:MAG: hypothetical protein KBD78_11960 [Oligoflexales bacterium]|nr:hypothetical protein [Oligoflexales bacterium]
MKQLVISILFFALLSQTGLSGGSFIGGGSILKKFDSYIEESGSDLLNSKYAVVSDALFIEMMALIPEKESLLKEAEAESYQTMIDSLSIFRGIPVLKAHTLLGSKYSEVGFTFYVIADSSFKKLEGSEEEFLNGLFNYQCAETN